MSAVRENGHMLKDRFGEALWKVALEPECRMMPMCIVVSIHALSPLTDKIPVESLSEK